MTTTFTASCDCGHTTTAKTQALADFGSRRHSCAKQAVLNARAEHVAARQATDGPRRDCQHTQSRHEHGTRNAYVCDRCRCRRCRDAASRYERWRGKQRAYGRQSYVDAAPVRTHVRGLQQQGLGWKRIARMAGIHKSVMWKLLYGDPARNMAPSKRVRPDAAAKILAVDASLDTIGDHAHVDATGTHRRVQALVTIGWSQSKIAARLGVSPGNFCKVMGQRLVYASTARAVRDLYDDLWNVRPPEDNQRDRIAASRARNYAKARDWKPPLWWDEDTIDLPELADVIDLTDDLDDVAIERAMTGEPIRLTKPERDEAIRQLSAQGHTRTEIARRLRLNGQTVNLLLARLDTSDLEVTA